MSEKKVAVVVPVYKDVLNDFEKISLAQVQKNFTQCPVLFVAPEGKKFSYIPFNKEIIYFPNEDFLNLLNHGKLLLGKSFYNKVFGYEDIFIYKLDSFSPADETELSLFRSYINCFENIFSELTKEVAPKENFAESKKSVASDDNFFAELDKKISSAKTKKSDSLRNNLAELKKFLLGVALNRLNYRLDNNLSLLRYIPKKFYPIVRIINLPYPKNVFDILSSEKFFIGDEIFLYGANDLNKLLQDLNQAKDKNNLIITTGIGDDAAIQSEIKNFGIDATEKFIFFNTEYINSCEKIFHNLGKTSSASKEKISKPKNFGLSNLKSSLVNENSKLKLNFNLASADKKITRVEEESKSVLQKLKSDIAFKNVSKSKNKRISAPRNNPDELRKWLLGIAIDRLNRRLDNLESLRRYIPEKYYLAVRVVDLPYPRNVWRNLRMGKDSIGDKVFYYDGSDLNELIRDLRKLKNKPNLLITTGIADDREIMNAMQRNNISLNKNFVFFNTAYIEYWEDFLKNIGK